MTPQIQRRLQALEARVLPLWKTQILLQNVQANPENEDSDKTEVKHIDTEEQSLDYTQIEYTTP